MHIDILITALFQLLSMILIGFLLRKKEVITGSGVKQLSKLLTTCVLPLSVISSGNRSYDSQIARKLVWGAIIAVLYYIIAIFLTYLFFRLVEKDERRRGPSLVMSIFGNIGFIGLPLANALYGHEGLLITIIFNMAYNIFFFSVGVRFLGGGGEAFSLSRFLTDPLIAACLLSILLFISPVKIPQAINGIFSQIGSMMAPLSMLVVGAQFVGGNWKSAFRTPSSYIVTFLKLIAIPLLVWAILRLFISDPVLLGTIVLLSSLPTGSLAAIFAEKYHADIDYVNGTLLLCTSISVVTIPLMMTLLLT